MSAPTNKTQTAGFAALMSAIIISLSLLVMVTAVSYRGFAARFTILESELKETSVFLAEACVQTALLKITRYVSYSGNETIPVGSLECRIGNITGPISARTIRASASFRGAHTNLVVVVDASRLPEVAIIAWEEVATLP